MLGRICKARQQLERGRLAAISLRCSSDRRPTQHPNIDFGHRPLGWPPCVLEKDGLMRTITFSQRLKGKEKTPIRSAASWNHAASRRAHN
jgi:hypothetical protein